jgi:DNA-binding GntR family transcriptional regulator
MSDTSTAELAYRHVKDRVLTGDLEGGRMISEGEVAAALGASRTPVREAFLRLEVEGWLRLYPKRGALVVPVAPGEIEEVLDARALLEAHAATFVVTRPDDLAELLDALDQAVARQEAAHRDGDLPAYAAADADFHQLVADAGANSLLSGFYRGLRERQQRMTADALRGRRSAAATVLDEHRRLRDLLAAGDVAAFTATLADHLETTHGHRPGGPR